MGLFLICIGLVAIWARRAISDALNDINRHTWNPLGPSTPRLSVIWGVGMIIVGVYISLGY